MKIAVISDTHDNIWNLDKALQIIKEKQCEAIIHCGDFCAPFSALRVVQSGLPVYAVFGNNDEDQWGIVERCKDHQFQVWPLGKEFAEIELDGKKIAFCHYPKLGKLLGATGDYQAVFHGHTHVAYQERVGDTILANPGAVCGIVKWAPGPASFGIHDTQTNTFGLINL